MFVIILYHSEGYYCVCSQSSATVLLIIILYDDFRVVCEARVEIKIAKLHFMSCPGRVVVAGVDETTGSENI